MFTQLNSIQIQSVIKIYSDAEKKGYWISIKINIFYYKNRNKKFWIYRESYKNVKNGWIYWNQR